MEARPSTIHSATALATPAEWVTQTASASQKPRSFRDSPRTGMPSGVKEKTPLKPSSISVSRRAGIRSRQSSQLGAQSSSVKGNEDGISMSFARASSYGRIANGSTGSGLWA